jgi:ABC-type amino acid transport substrate-binding protein
MLVTRLQHSRSPEGRPAARWLRALGLLLAAALSWSALQAAPTTRVRVPPFDAPRDGRPGYFFEVLELALKKTLPTQGPYEVIVSPELMSLERAANELKKGQHIDVLFTAPNPGLTDGLRAIPVSLLKELNNYRILLIRQGEQARFDRIRSLDDLRRLRAGLGLQWVDTKILRDNGFQVEGSALHDNLFSMLAARRFDFFPRGIYEVQSDLKKYQHLGLAIEKRLFLYYEAPFYFFVHPDRTDLAERIEKGLRIALADGSFDRLLNQYPEFRAALELQRSAQRRLLRLAPLHGSCRPAPADAGCDAALPP